MKMIKNLFLFTVLLVCTNIFSQNTQFKSHKFELEFNQPEFFKNLKTISYEIQDDGTYWNHEYDENDNKPENYRDFPTLQSFTEGLKVKGYEYVENEGDIQIVVGFTGSQLQHVENGLQLQGTMNLMVLVDGDKMIHNEVRRVKSIVPNSKEYPTETRFYRNKTKAMLLTKKVQDYIDSNVGVLFTGKSEVELYFGLFRNAKKGKAKEFNDISTPLIEEIKTTQSSETLKKAVEYWKEQVDVDYGKKLKLKRKLKVIYANLTTASILLGDIDNAKEYAKIARKNAGFLDYFNNGYNDYEKKLKYVSENQDLKMHGITKEGRYAYEIDIKEEGEFDLGKKSKGFSRIIIQRYLPVASSNSGMMSLDAGESPTAKLFIDGEPKYIYNCSSKHSIKLKNGKTIIFKLQKGEYVPYVTVDGAEVGRLH